MGKKNAYHEFDRRSYDTRPEIIEVHSRHVELGSILWRLEQNGFKQGVWVYSWHMTRLGGHLHINGVWQCFEVASTEE